MSLSPPPGGGSLRVPRGLVTFHWSPPSRERGPPACCVLEPKGPACQNWLPSTKLSGSPSVRCASMTVAGPNWIAGTGFTVVATEAELLFGFGSLVEPETEAVFVITPVCVGLTVMSAELLAAAARLPNVQVT